MAIINQLQRRKPQYEINSGLSETTPDQALSVREILTRYASGTMPNVKVYEENYTDDMPDIRFMGHDERLHFLDAVREETEEIQTFIKSKNEEAKKRGRPRKDKDQEANGVDETSTEE